MLTGNYRFFCVSRFRGHIFDFFLLLLSCSSCYGQVHLYPYVFLVFFHYWTKYLPENPVFPYFGLMVKASFSDHIYLDAYRKSGFFRILVFMFVSLSYLDAFGLLFCILVSLSFFFCDLLVHVS